jgi:competence ComEA-like helix-hairpin-helix protein
MAKPSINTATVEDIEAIRGIGRHTAELIVDYREKHGGVGDIKELSRVEEMTDERLESLQENFSV